MKENGPFSFTHFKKSGSKKFDVILHLFGGALFPQADEAANYFACRVAAWPVVNNARMRTPTVRQHQKITVVRDDNPLLRPRQLHVFLVGGAAQSGFNRGNNVNTPAA
jgi:hypothetical protein